MTDLAPNPPTPIPPHFSYDREVHVILSTHSGKHEAKSYFDSTLRPYMLSHVPHLELKKNLFLHHTTSSTSISTLTTKLFLFNARKGVKQTILLLSGDGGIIDLINTLTTTLQREIDDIRPPSIFFKPQVLLFPLGTANALAHSAGIVKRGPLEVMMGGCARPLPQFEVKFSRGARLVADEGRKRLELAEPGYEERDEGNEFGYYDPEGNVRVYGCVVVSWGLHASLVALSDTAEMRKHGIERFKMAAEMLLEEGHVYAASVKLRRERGGKWLTLKQKGEGGEESIRHKYILTTMVSNLEETFCISPYSKPMDGKLRLLAIGNQPSDKVMQVMMQAYEQGKHIDESKDVVTYEEIESLRIEFDEAEEKWRQICVDGKIFAIEEGGWVEMRNMPAGGVDGRRVIELVC